MPLVSAAEAAGTPAAEALAVGVIRAMAGACGPRDMYVMVLEALQTRVRAVTDAAAAANHELIQAQGEGHWAAIAAPRRRRRGVSVVAKPRRACLEDNAEPRARVRGSMLVRRGLSGQHRQCQKPQEPAAKAAATT